MILIFFIAVLLLGGILAGISARWSKQLPRWISLAAIAVDFVLAARIWARPVVERFERLVRRSGLELGPELWHSFSSCRRWSYFLTLILTFFLGIVAVLCSWTEIREKVGFFHFNLMWVLGGIVSVFLAMDLFLFYFAWELMLIPMYFRS